MKLDKLKNKKILILGFAREGQDTFLFLRKIFPKKNLSVADKDKNILSRRFYGCKKIAVKRDKKIKFYLGENYLKSLKNYDIIIKAPGIPYQTIASFLKKKQKITSQTEIFFENCPDKIIGVTGTKGKSTTSSIIYQILKEKKDIKVHLIGNIGKPALNLLLSSLNRKKTSSLKRKKIYVYELSSHQLSNLKKSPQIAVFLNLFADHLDYYKNFKEYARAKSNIALYQKKNDYLIYNSQNKIIKEIAKKSKAKKIIIPSPFLADEFLKKVRVSLPGKFYFHNIMAAVMVGKIFEIPDKKIKKAIEDFKPLPHRLEPVGIFKNIGFYNDSLATMPEATMAALEALGDKVETIILGGFERNIDFKKLSLKIVKSKIKTIVLFPATGERIWKTIEKARKDIMRQNKEKIKKEKILSHFFIQAEKGEGKKAMKEAVKLAYEHTSKGKVCLLSTACASFGLFKDYKERGDLFKKYVKLLGK